MFYHRDIKAKHSSLSSLDLDCKCSAAAYTVTLQTGSRKRGKHRSLATLYGSSSVFEMALKTLLDKTTNTT